MDHRCDVLVIGGGLSGAATARDLAGRGWRVLLCEQGDLGGQASSATGKLLENCWLDLQHGHLVRAQQVLQEREWLLRCAPHLVSPLRVVWPHDPTQNAAWRVRLGLWVADHLLARASWPGHAHLDLSDSPLGASLQSRWRQGFVVSEGWVDDARLVALCAVDAAERGAQVLTRTRCDRLGPGGGGWRAELVRHDASSGRALRRLRVQARAVVNATGAWAEHLLREVVQWPVDLAAPQGGVALPASRWHKSSHIVVARRLGHDHGFAFAGAAGGRVSATPFERNFTLIGPCKTALASDMRTVPSGLSVTPEEVDWLCRSVNRWLRQAVSPEEVVWSFAALRPVQPVGQALLVHHRPAPWLTVRGGPLASFRRQAELAASQVGALLGERRAPWTAAAPLPGGDLGELVDAPSDPLTDMALFQQRLRQRHPWIDLPLLRRWTRAYGGRVLRMLDGVSSRGDLGAQLGPDLYEAELFHLKSQEWVLTSEDALWRRSKLGLHFSPAQRDEVARWFDDAARHEGLGFHRSEVR